MRKGLLLLLSIVMLLSFVACTQEPVEETSSEAPTLAVTASPDYTEEPTVEPTEEPEEKWLVADDYSTYIECQSKEIKDGMVYETVTLMMDAKGTFVQFDHLLTDLIGKNGQDGQGYIQIVVGNGTAEEIADAYFLVQLVGSYYTGYAIPGLPSEDAMTWYPRGNSVAAGYSSIFLNQGGSLAVPNMKYGNHASICEEGYKFTFTQNAEGKVLIRSLNENSSAAIQSFDSTTTLVSEYALREIVGDNGKTGEDGVYFRLASYTSEEQTFTITVVYPA